MVYKAHHHTLTDQMVALKVPTNPDVRELMRGGAIQYRVEHSGVVKVVDIDLSADPPFMAMEWVEGQTLRDRMDQAGKITVEAALPILEQILKALDAAHAQGIVHRDLKPANILIDNLGTVKIRGIEHERTLVGAAT